VFQFTETKNIFGKGHFGQHYNIGTESVQQTPKSSPYFNFKNFGEFQKFSLDRKCFCFMQLNKHCDQIITYKYTLREWVSQIWTFYEGIVGETGRADIPKSFLSRRTTIRDHFEFNINLIQSHLRRHLRF
jgi:hypothetical protein